MKIQQTQYWAACGLIRSHVVVCHSCITSWADECSLVYNLVNSKNNYEATFMLTRILLFLYVILTTTSRGSGALGSCLEEDNDYWSCKTQHPTVL